MSEPTTTPAAAVAAVPEDIRKLSLPVEKECKGSVRYGLKDPDAALESIYVSRKAWNRMPKRVTIILIPEF